MASRRTTSSNAVSRSSVIPAVPVSIVRPFIALIPARFCWHYQSRERPRFVSTPPVPHPELVGLFDVSSMSRLVLASKDTLLEGRGVAEDGTMLKALLRQRHWQTYSTFCAQYDKVART